MTLITDHTSAVSAQVVPGGVQGVIRPEVGNPSDLLLDFVDSSKRGAARARPWSPPGWTARGLSLAASRRGIPIGRVTEASIAEQEASQQVHVRPFADMRELDLVQVLTGRRSR